MARQFDGVDDVIVATITAMDSGDWTIAAWVKPASAGEGNVGVIVRIQSGTTAIQYLAFAAVGRTLDILQRHATTIAESVSTTTLPANAWSCVVATYRASDSKCRAWVGSPSAAMAEVSYATQVAGVGTRTTAGTTFHIGNRSTTAATFDGSIADVVAAAREWSLDEMEAFRLGTRPITTGTMRGFWPLDSPTASQAEDLSGNGANGTVTGAIVAEDPPIPMGWGETVRPVLRVVAGGATVTGTATSNFGGITASAAGTPTVIGSASASFGGLAATAAGTRSILASASVSLGGLTAVASGTVSVIGTAAANLGGLTGIGTGARSVTGTASASFGGLTASAVGGAPITWFSFEGSGGVSSAEEATSSVSGLDEVRVR